MKSSSSFRAACLSIGLATAWSPPAQNPALADTVGVHLNLGTSSLNIPSFTDVYVGLLINGADKDIQNLPGDFASSQDGTDLSFSSAGTSADTIQYVTVGVLATNHVMVSFANAPYGLPFGSVFTDPDFTGFDETSVYNQLTSGDTSFVDRILTVQQDGIMQSMGDQASFVAFSDGEAAGDVTLSIESAPVPLPTSVVMGGALLASVVTGKRARAWISTRNEVSLA